MRLINCDWCGLALRLAGSRYRLGHLYHRECLAEIISANKADAALSARLAKTPQPVKEKLDD